MSDIRQIIQKPVITEKSTRLKETSNKYVFRVDVKANKRQIKRAVEELFNVHVLDVKTAMYRGKRTVVMNRAGRFEGLKPRWKKAIVRLAEGETIDVFDVV
ncbi:MAG: 50S ribosomal protein L23 [Candidatus Latescibacteria bacterium]|nr:50S ribosomal protein L23 [Candidatus Latescibacterota bacterium]NIM20824.1 50S ribosomal protein L23 [Candidatus Latescibacterota bacterium]NIM64390.1 50S ribosomal protein L23 [Candidatus Latescibacterota bacterium]NIO00541.1 50S ribosomal protein L23 [Candidatus Latescibacterota bacterium]NIO26944.1 50S ribosomal protein L23 [Candidatus Latescibacterota bacterium]